MSQLEIKMAGKKKRSFKKKSRRMAPVRQPVNTMIYRTRWEYGLLNSGTTGTISAGNISPSITNSSEYSTMQALFTEVRLLQATMTFVARVAFTGAVVNDALYIGTNMLFNNTTFTTPASINDVQNLTRMIVIQTYQQRPFRYRMPVPPGLEFTSITADSPALVSPWAGSPGCVVVYGTNLSITENYFSVHVEATYELRGRQ